MARTITVESPREISKVVDAIHDHWFDKENIVLEPGTSVLSIRYKREAPEKGRTIGRFWFIKRIKVPVLECFLKIHHVKDISVTDKEQVGIYDFNELKYNPSEKQVTITAGVPINIKVTVDQFKVVVEETDNVVEERVRVSIGKIGDGRKSEASL